MTTPRNHRDLFIHSDISHKLDLFRSLLDSKDLTFDEALALLSAIHAELRHPKVHPSSMYIRYAEAVESLHQQMPDVHDQVVNAWQAKRGIIHSGKNSVEGLQESQASARSESPVQNVDEFLEDGQVEGEPMKGSHETIHPTESNEEPVEAVEEGEEEHEEPEEESEEENEDEKEEVGEGEAEEEQEEENEESEEKEVEAEEASERNEAAEESTAEADHMAGEAAEAAAESEHVEVEMEEAQPSGEEEPPLEAGE